MPVNKKISDISTFNAKLAKIIVFTNKVDIVETILQKWPWLRHSVTKFTYLYYTGREKYIKKFNLVLLVKDFDLTQLILIDLIFKCNFSCEIL